MIATVVKRGAMRLLAGLLALVAVVGLVQPQQAQAKGFAASRVSGSVVYVAVSNGSRIIGHGSGFIVAPGVVVTNSHVVNSGSEFFVIRNGTGGDSKIEARVMLVSRKNDIAILSAPGLKGPALTIAAGEPAQGVDVWALGFPELADAFSADDRALATLTSGNVSRVLLGHAMTGGSQTTRLVQHTALIAPGSSGGPLFDGCYRVVGVNTQISSQNGSTYVFAIASSVLPALLRDAGVRATISRAACGDSPAAGKAPPGADDGDASRVGGSGGGDSGGSKPGKSGGGDDGYRDIDKQLPSDADGPNAHVVKPQADPVRPAGDAAANRRAELEEARRRADAARKRAADAEAARQRAIAANDQAEAARQADIAEKSRKIAKDLDAYSGQIEDQIDKIKADPLDRYLPIGLLIAALVALSAIGWWGTRAYAKARRRRDAKLAELRSLEGEAAEMAGQDVALVSPDGTLKLSGAKLRSGLVVGRSAQRADVILPKEAVGRAHARFAMRDDRLFVTDLGSANGTFINDNRITPNMEQEIRDGDRVSFSKLHAFRVRFQ